MTAQTGVADADVMVERAGILVNGVGEPRRFHPEMRWLVPVSIPTMVVGYARR
jgi:hypothetical protein